jgi:uncharacterized phiE125 gp8 family phage protein
MTSGLSITVVSRPHVEPVTLAVVKAAGNIDIDADDEFIETVIIPAARNRAEEFLRRALVEQTLRVTFDRFPCGDLVLPIAPVQFIEQLEYRDSAGTWREFTAFEVDTANEPVRISPTGAWPAVSYLPGSVRVTFRAGYEPAQDDSQGSPTIFDYRANIPPEIKAGIIADCVYRYEHRQEQMPEETYANLMWSQRMCI